MVLSMKDYSNITNTDLKNTDVKQVIIVRTDLKMSKGKTCAQVAHASLEACEISRKKFKKIYEKWKTSGAKKIVLKVDSEEEILELYEKAKEKDLPCYLVKDAGLTELEPGTITALGIGPYISSEIDKITGDLKLL